MNTKKKYAIKAKVNNETITKRTDDIEEGILAIKPDFVHTEMYITASDHKMISSRKLTLIQARKLFADSVYRRVFINNLLLS